jgi:hypothetical protein
MTSYLKLAISSGSMYNEFNIDMSAKSTNHTRKTYLKNDLIFDFFDLSVCSLILKTVEFSFDNKLFGFVLLFCLTCWKSKDYVDLCRLNPFVVKKSFCRTGLSFLLSHRFDPNVDSDRDRINGSKQMIVRSMCPVAMSHLGNDLASKHLEPQRIY